MKFRHKKPDTLRQRHILDGYDHSSSSVSYYSRRSDEEMNTGRKVQRKITERVNYSKRAMRLHRLTTLFLCIVAIIVLLNVMSLSTNATVMPESTDLSGLFSRNQAVYKAEVQKLLAQSIWNRNKITIDTNGIAQKVMSTYPEVTDVSFMLPILGHTPTVYIQIASPALILNDNNGSYVVDDSGKVLTENVSTASFASLKLPVITDQSGITLTRNTQALPTTDVSFIQTIIAQLAARNFTVESMTLPAATSELDVRLEGQPYYIKFNLESGDARQQVGTFLATQASLQSQNITPTKYIDVRVDGRAYYL